LTRQELSAKVEFRCLPPKGDEVREI
jgi:hypothetical protein